MRLTPTSAQQAGRGTGHLPGAETPTNSASHPFIVRAAAGTAALAAAVLLLAGCSSSPAPAALPVLGGSSNGAVAPTTAAPPAAGGAPINAAAVDRGSPIATATAFITAYASGDTATACQLTKYNYLTEMTQRGLCGRTAPDNARVTLVDSCQGPDSWVAHFVTDPAVGGVTGPVEVSMDVAPQALGVPSVGLFVNAAPGQPTASCAGRAAATSTSVSVATPGADRSSSDSVAAAFVKAFAAGDGASACQLADSDFTHSSDTIGYCNQTDKLTVKFVGKCKTAKDPVIYTYLYTTTPAIKNEGAFLVLTSRDTGGHYTVGAVHPWPSASPISGCLH